MQDPKLQLGEYGLLKRLGEGTFGGSYAVREGRKGQALLKVLPGLPLTDDVEPRLAQLRRDLEVLSLDHPNVVSYRDAGYAEETPQRREGGGLFLVRELVDGPDIYRFSARAAWATIMEVVVSLLRGLEALHGRGLLHGNLIANNVIVFGTGPRKSARLLDAGLALDLAETRSWVGTSHAPEVLAGGPPDRRSDLYDLGVLLFHAATRSPLFGECEGPAALRIAHLSEAPPTARSVKRSVPVAMDELISSLLRKDPAERPPSANAVIRELNRRANKRFSTETRDNFLGVPLRPRLQGRGELLREFQADSNPVTILSAEPGAGRTRMLQAFGRCASSARFVQAATPTLADALRAACAPPPFGDPDYTDPSDRANEDEAPPPIVREGPFLARLVPDLLPEVQPAKLLPAGRERQRVLEASLRVLRAHGSERDLWLGIDDLQRADSLLLDTLRLLAHDTASADPDQSDEVPASLAAEAASENSPTWPLQAGPRAGTVRVMATLLPDEVFGHGAETAFRALLGTDGVREVRLENLSAEDQAQAVAAAIGRDTGEARPLSDALGDADLESVGAALDLVTELGRAGALPPPDGAWFMDEERVKAALDEPRGCVARQLESVSPEARRLAHALALLRGAGELDHLAALGGRFTVLGAARELERAGLLAPLPSHAMRPEGVPALSEVVLHRGVEPLLTRLELAGARVQEAVQASLSLEDADALHEVLGRAATSLPEAASHLLRSARPRAGVGRALQAAEEAAQRNEPERMRELLEPAQRALEGPEPSPGSNSDLELPEALRARLVGDPRALCERLLGDALLGLGRAGQARSCAQRASSVAREARDTRGMIEAALLLARASRALGDAPAAKSAADEAVEVAKGGPWQGGLALAYLERARSEAQAGDRQEALASFEEARGLLAARSDEVGQAGALRDTAALRLESGDLAGASEDLRVALDLDEEGDRPAEVTEDLLLRARVELAGGNHEAALNTTRRARALAGELIDLEALARALNVEAEVRRAQGELRQARQLEETALELWERTGAARWSARARLSLGRIQLQSGELSAAEANLAQAEQVFRQLGDLPLQAEVGLALAEAYLARGELGRSRDSIERSLREAEGGPAATSFGLRAQLVRLAWLQGDLVRCEDSGRQVADDAARQGQVKVESLARVLLGLARLRRGNLIEAERELREAYGLAKERGERSLMARAHLALGAVHLVRGEPSGALGEVGQARDLAHEIEDAHLEVESLLALARLHVFLGQLPRAVTLLEMGDKRAGELGLSLIRPELQLGLAAARLAQARGLAVRDEDASQLLELATPSLDAAERALRAGSRRRLRARLDLLLAEKAQLSGEPGMAWERAQAALEASKITGDVLIAGWALRALSRARVDQGRYEEALVSAERAVSEAEDVREGEARAAALLERGLARRRLGETIQAAQDLRDAASHVRGIWAALPEDLRVDYVSKPLAREIIRLAAEVSQEAEQALETSGVDASAARSAPAPAPAPAAGTLGGTSPATLSDEGGDSLESLRDPLTDLFNHTFFTAQLETELKRGLRHSRPLALLKINIDRFKLVRELYGPKAAKEIIREVAGLLLRNVRDVDIVARYFGDEFEVLLPDTEQHGALLTSQRIADAVEAHRFEFEDEKIELTLTTGIALFPRDAKDKDALICRVDEALYNARARGPNQVFSFGGNDEALAGETSREMRELDEMMLSREGRTILSMVQRLVNQELDMDRVIELVTGMVVEATRGERGFIMLRGQDGAFSFRHGRNLDDKVVGSPELKISNNIAADVAKTGQAVMVSEAIEDDRFRDFKSVMDLGLRSILCAPIKVDDGDILGVIYVDHNQVARNFTREDLNFLVAIADKVAIPLKNSKRLRETEDRLALAEARLKSQASQLQTKYSYDTIIGRSEAMQDVFKLLDRIVETNHSVVIHGESGTGKELIARAIHFNGPRKNKPFVAENCAALSDTLLEAELFGHVKGAFTGADRDSKGLFELANGGTLFLDEIGDMSERMQKKLLRVLQEGEIRPVGGKRVFHVDVRIVSASNKDLKRMVDEHKFREDLYYRLNVIKVSLPPLRERRDDVMLLAQHFFRKHTAAGDERDLGRETLNLLMSYDWPGNVRELENEVNRLVAMSDNEVTPDLLSPKIRERTTTKKTGDDNFSRFYNRPLKDVEKEFMREVIRHTLEETNWHRTLAAKVLQVPTSTLFNKMKKYNIEPGNG
jgi:Nif-specific regulatory protein